ncbi:MAG: pentapeptide repeat-containing protein [Oceanicaulis sp.]|nr:pentapeptide repeat-containing protein [Oceanicaulis sp.]
MSRRFARRHFARADLYRANLDGADFRKAVLYKDERDAEFKHNDWLIDAEGDGRDGAVDFRDCTLRGARLSAAKLKGADFSGPCSTAPNSIRLTCAMLISRARADGR